MAKRNNDLTAFIEFLTKKDVHMFIHRGGREIEITFPPEEVRTMYDEYLKNVSMHNAAVVATVNED